MQALILRLDAPLISFGGVAIDQHGVTERFPGTAMLCGLIANALGWRHGYFRRLQDLQARIEYAARWDVAPTRLVDYHTVDLGQRKMRLPGWTTRGHTEHRRGGRAAKFGTHQRYRHYWTDGLMTIALSLREGEDPSLGEVRAAIEQPARPLFLGRKTCLPARPLVDPHSPVMEGDTVRRIVERVPVWDRKGRPTDGAGARQACWPADLGPDANAQIRRVYDLRDWANQIPTGSRWRAEGLIGEDQG